MISITEFFALMFIVFALIGTVNAFNIIDGFNGLLLVCFINCNGNILIWSF